MKVKIATRKFVLRHVNAQGFLSIEFIVNLDDQPYFRLHICGFEHTSPFV